MADSSTRVFILCAGSSYRLDKKFVAYLLITSMSKFPGKRKEKEKEKKMISLNSLTYVTTL